MRRIEDDPLPFVAPSLTRRTPDNENTAEPATVDFAPPKPAAPPLPGWRTAPLDELGTVQLVERLAASLEKRRAQAAAAPTLAPPPAAPREFEAAPADDAAQAMAAYFAKSKQQASEPLAAGDDDWSADEEVPAESAYGSLLGRKARSGDLPPRGFEQPLAAKRARDNDEALREALATLQRMSAGR
jgi:hypothetical protein